MGLILIVSTASFVPFRLRRDLVQKHLMIKENTTKNGVMLRFYGIHQENKRKKSK